MAKTIKLSKPLKINQQDVNEVVLDFNKITGATYWQQNVKRARVAKTA